MQPAMLTLDAQGFIHTKNGARVGRVEGETLWLYDRHARAEVPLTLREFERFVKSTNHEQESTDHTR